MLILPEAISRFSEAHGITCFPCMWLTDPSMGSPPPASSLILSSAVHLYDPALLGRFGFFHHSTDMPSSFTPQGLLPSDRNTPIPDDCTAFSSFKSLLKCHPFKQALPSSVMILPMLAELFLFSMFPWHTAYLPTDCSSSPAQNIRAQRPELPHFSSLQFPQPLGSVFHWKKDWLDSLGLISRIMAQDIFNRVSVLNLC